MTIAFCWVFPILLLALPLTKLWGEFVLECGTRDCVIIRNEEGTRLLGFLTLFGFLLPVFTLIIANIAIFSRVKVRINLLKGSNSKEYYIFNDIVLYNLKLLTFL